MGFFQIPFLPGDFIVLTIRVIISAGRFSPFIPHKDKRCPLRRKQHHQSILHQLHPQRKDSLFSRLSLYAAVPAVIFIFPVPVVLPVCLVVFLFIGDQIGKPEPVICRQIVDLSAVVRIFALAVQKLLQHPAVPFEETPDGIRVFPSGTGKVSLLIRSGFLFRKTFVRLRYPERKPSLFYFFYLLPGKPFAPELCIRKSRFHRDLLQRNGRSQQFKSVNMITVHPI